jgi:hypothetical protein
MDVTNVVRSDTIEQYLDRSRELFSQATTWSMNLIGQSQDVSWDTATKFLSDYLLLPLVVLLGLLIVVKRALGD